jgi:hypothetical protein
MYVYVRWRLPLDACPVPVCYNNLMDVDSNPTGQFFICPIGPADLPSDEIAADINWFMLYNNRMLSLSNQTREGETEKNEEMKGFYV